MKDVFFGVLLVYGIAASTIMFICWIEDQEPDDIFINSLFWPAFSLKYIVKFIHWFVVGAAGAVHRRVLLPARASLIPHREMRALRRERMEKRTAQIEQDKEETRINAYVPGDWR